MMVLDASVVIEVLLGTGTGRNLEERLRGESLHAPALVDLEVTQVLRRLTQHAEMSPARGREAVVDLIDLPMRRFPHGPFLPRIWELRANLTAYDAAYVALAEELDALLLTRDRRLAKSKRHRAHIALI